MARRKEKFFLIYIRNVWWLRNTCWISTNWKTNFFNILKLKYCIDLFILCHWDFKFSSISLHFWVYVLYIVCFCNAYSLSPSVVSFEVMQLSISCGFLIINTTWRTNHRRSIEVILIIFEQVLYNTLNNFSFQ